MYDILVKVGADISDFSSKMAQSNQALQRFNQANQQTFDSFKKVGAVSVAAGTALAGGLGYAVTRAANFESAMSSVAAISGATGKDFELLSEKAREMGSKTSFSAIEAAEGLEYMALAGWDTNQMLSGIEPVLHLAEAGALELGRASDLVTDSMSALGVEVDDLEGYLDKVAQTSRKSNTDIDALMEALIVAGGKFRELNVPLEESNAMLGVLANRGFKGSEAGTAMNAILTRLTATTGPSAKALEELGISAFDSEGNFRGMEVVMKDVEKALSNMDDEQRAHYQTQIAGLNHGKAFSAMLDGLGNEYAELKDDVVNSNGALEEMRDIMKDNLQGALEELSSAFDEIMIAIGESLLPYVQKLVEWLQALADWFNNLSNETQQKIAIFLALSSVLLIVAGGMMLLIGFIPQIISGFQALVTVAKAVGGAFTGISLPALALVVTIGVVIAAIVHLWRTNEEFRNNVTQIWENIKTLILSVWEAIQPGAQVFIGILMALIGVMAQVIGWVAQVVAAFTSWVVAFIETHSWIMTVIQVIAVIGGVIAGLVAVVMVIVKVFMVLVTIVKVVAAVLAFLTSPIGIVIAVIGLLVAAVMWLGEKFEWLGNILDGVASFMSNAWNKFLGFFGGGTKEAADEAEEAIDGVAESGKESLDDFAESGTESVSQLNEGVTSEIGDMAASSTDLIDGMSIKGIGSMDALSNEGVGAISEMNAGVTSEIGDMSALGIADLDALEIGGIDAMSGLDAGVTSNVSDMASDVKKQVGDMENAASGDFSGLANDMTANAQKIKTDVSKSFADISSTVKKEMNSIKTMSADGIKGFSTNITKGMSQASKTIQTAMRQITTGIANSFRNIDRVVSTSTTKMTQSIMRGFMSITRVTTTSMTSLVRVVDAGTKRQSLSIKNGMTRNTQAYRTGFNRMTSAARTGMSQSISAVNNASARMVATVRRLQSQFYSAGVYAMSGLRSGLNAGSGSVLATASSIANRVASTMRAALKVRSPSRVMMEIGKWVSLGLADGLMDYAKHVERASDYVAESAIPDMRNVDLSYNTPTGIRNTLASAVRGTVDVNSRDSAVVAELKSIREELRSQRQMIVELDGERVGRTVTPHVNRENALDDTIKRYF